jgi:putative nucleotidyltransferase with HDIG domain
MITTIRACSLSQAATSEFERPLLLTLNQLGKHLKDEQKQQQAEVFSSLTLALHSKDGQLYKHSQRVQQYVWQLAYTLGLPKNELQTIELAALFHDIGKIGISDVVLNKPSRLTDMEYDYVKEHALRGAMLLTQSRVLSKLAPLVRSHHERWDGFGYPFGLQGEAIPLGARIIAIADAFEAMTANRVYQAARSTNWALDELRHCAGSHFDPVLVERFCDTYAPVRLSIGQELSNDIQ